MKKDLKERLQGEKELKASYEKEIKEYEKKIAQMQKFIEMRKGAIKVEEKIIANIEDEMKKEIETNYAPYKSYSLCNGEDRKGWIMQHKNSCRESDKGTR